MDEEPRDPLLGHVLDGRYELLERIGAGSMGVVYRALQTSMDREVAVKILRPELVSREKSVRRFVNEAKAISRLRHPNTLRIYDCRLLQSGPMYIVTELLRGRALSTLLASTGPLPYPRAVYIADRVAASLTEAHAAGIIHRDIKPENVFIDVVGGRDVVKVLDFGIAKILDGEPGLTTLGNVVGTPAYFSPEQARGHELDARSDLYALGVLLYHMIVGSPPFSGKGPAETIAFHLFMEPPPIEEAIPEALATLIEEMLAKSPEARPATAKEIRERFKQIG